MAMPDRFSAKPSKDKFARMVSNALRDAGIRGELNYHSEGFAIVFKIADGTSFTANLDNIYTDFGEANKEHRNAELKKYAAGIVAIQLSPPADYQIAKRNLLPLVRSAIDDLGTLRHFEEGDVEEPSVSSQPLIADIVVQLGFDSEHSICRIAPQQLNVWGVTFEQALSDAVENLRDRTTDEWSKIGSGAFRGRWQDHYDTSRVLLLDCLYRLPIAGDPVVLLPTRATLLVTGADDREGQRLIIAAAEQALKQQSRRSSLSMLRYTGTAWQVFMPEGPPGERLLALQQESLAQDYEHQKAVLDKAHEAADVDVYVPAYSLISKDGSKKVISYGTWMKDVDALLPVTDIIIFVKRGETQTAIVETAAIPWDTAMNAVGALMKQTNHMPARWRVCGFPDPALFEHFKAISVIK